MKKTNDGGPGTEEKEPGRRKSRKFGKILISDIAFDEFKTEGLARLFSRFFPLRCEFLYSRGAFEYEGWCEDFRVLGNAEGLPDYEAVFIGENGEKLEFREKDRRELMKFSKNEVGLSWI